MKYKYTRKDIYKFIKSVKRWKDISCIIEDLLLATEDKTKKMSFNDFVVNNHHLWKTDKECKHNWKLTPDTWGETCFYCGKQRKIKTTPSPLEIEEIEEIRQDTLSEYISHQSLATAINSLIRNQKKLYQLIKEKL